jgi:hypothetical protein
MNLRLVKQVARIIEETREVLTDNMWEERWTWHTDPGTFRQGGEWVTVTAARKIIELVKKG